MVIVKDGDFFGVALLLRDDAGNPVNEDSATVEKWIYCCGSANYASNLSYYSIVKHTDGIYHFWMDTTDDNWPGHDGFWDSAIIDGDGQDADGNPIGLGEIDYALDIYQLDSLPTGNADSFKATGFSTHSESDVVNALLAKTGITAGGSASFADILKSIYAACRGKMTVSTSGNDLIINVLDDDNSTTLFTLTANSSGRTVS